MLLIQINFYVYLFDGIESVQSILNKFIPRLLDMISICTEETKKNIKNHINTC